MYYMGPRRNIDSVLLLLKRRCVVVVRLVAGSAVQAATISNFSCDLWVHLTVTRDDRYYWCYVHTLRPIFDRYVAGWGGWYCGSPTNLLLYDDFRFSHSRFACVQSSVRVCLALYIRARFCLGSRMRAILSKRQNLTCVSCMCVYVCACAFIWEKSRVKVRETQRPKERCWLRRGSEGELRISHYIYIYIV